MAETGKDLIKAKSLLEEGQLVAIPTETVYGLAGNALNESAILEIFRVKNRPKFDPLIAHTDSLDKVKNLVTQIPDELLELGKTFWPGPLTLLLEKKAHVPDLLTSGLPYVAVRIPNHPLTSELLSSLEFPLASPSANPFGYISPTTAGHVQDQLGDLIPYILDGGACTIGLESTILGFDQNHKPVIHRLGGMRIEQIESVIGPVKLNINVSSNPSAPGMLKSHYAPRTPLVRGNVEELIEKNINKNFGVISFSKRYAGLGIDRQIILSERGDMDEAANRLFGALRQMDNLGLDIIFAEIFPELGLGAAINDRLKRAASN
ncbi:MAG: threonylcarbamoyl-AMP synthase [Cyclobacteriaceae bacterium]